MAGAERRVIRAVVRNERINIGIGVLIYLGILLMFAYALKRAYWKDIH
jgi:ubiquinol-cytochrome c reductase cytochrome c1 subunit